MAAPVADAYVAPSGAAVYAGRFPSGGVLTGAVTLEDILAAGGGSSAAGSSDLNGTAALDGISAGGTVTSLPMAFDDNFERSSVDTSLSSITGVGDGALIRAVPMGQESEVTDVRWLEPSFEIVNCRGHRPEIWFENYKGTTGGIHAYDVDSWQITRCAMMSYDGGETHAYFSSPPTRNTTNQRLEFRHATAFSGERVRISRGRQMTVHQHGARLDALAAAHAYFGPSPTAASYTPTGAVSGYSGQSFIADEYSAQVDTLGRTIPATPFYAALINDTSLTATSGAKKAMVLNSGVHAGEDHAEFVLYAVIAWLCGSSAEAIRLRREYKIFIYPMLNAPGRAGGGWRGSFTQGVGGADDANRHYDDTLTTLEIIDKSKAVILADIAGLVKDILMDMHGNFGITWGVYANAADTWHQSFQAKLATRTGQTIVDLGDTTGINFAGYWKLAGFKLSITHETGDPSPVSDGDIATHGQGIVEALSDMWDAGDFV